VRDFYCECYVCIVTAECHIEALSWSGHSSNPDCNVHPAGVPSNVKLNGIVIFNATSCMGKRGFHIQLVDPLTCSKIEYRNFDTYTSEHEAANLSDYLDQLSDYSVVVGSMSDEAYRMLGNAMNGLLRIGVNLTDLQYRGSFAFVTQKSTNKTVLNKVVTAHASHVNPARVNVIITGRLCTIHYRILFEVAILLCTMSFNVGCPAYLCNLVTFTESDSARSRLRSSTTRSAVTVRTRTKFGSRTFSVSGPTVRKSLPSELRLVNSRSTFCRRLKSHYFQLAFN